MVEEGLHLVALAAVVAGEAEDEVLGRLVLIGSFRILVVEHGADADATVDVA